ncbi:hypothetical protein MY04_5069 [Flammeovirga sp. MY04]|uniref:hypothetical protein n=1 Tax=Flammeovirga sp. MY04 TaxID=1191459 RepID=UPI0008060CFF|nr:hypothetical protein [Flammeovirga sp. MY04]ANQ52404.1 hypothetical protein MY04_5069 [Flammeovirga sp. MY04]
MKNKLTTLVAILGYLLLLTTSCDKSEEEINGGDDPVNGMDGVTVSASDPTIGYTSLELIGSIANYEDSLEASAKFVLYDGEEVVSEKTFTDLQNQEYTLEVDQLTSGKEYQYDFSVIRGEDVVTTGKKKVSTQEVKTNFAADGGFTSFRINGALEGVLENTKIDIVTEVLSGETVVKTVTNEYDSDVEELEIVVPGLDMATNYSSKVTVKYGDEALSEEEYDFKTHTFSVSTKDVSNNQGGLYMEGTFTSDIEPNDDLALGFYYKKATDADDAYTWMDAEMKDETTLVAVGHGLDIGVAYDIKAAVKIVSEEVEEVAKEVKTLDDLHGGVFVDVAATGTGDGSSWENAFTSIKTAVETTEAAIEGKDNTINVLVRKGEYAEDENIVVSNSAFLNFYGGYNNNDFEKYEERNFDLNITKLLFRIQLKITNTNYLNNYRVFDGFNFDLSDIENPYSALFLGDGEYKIINCSFSNINGRGIRNHHTYLGKNYNISIENCDFENMTEGVYIDNSFDDNLVNIKNITFKNVENIIIKRFIDNNQNLIIDNLKVTGDNTIYVLYFDTDENASSYQNWSSVNNVCISSELDGVAEVSTKLNSIKGIFSKCN